MNAVLSDGQLEDLDRELAAAGVPLRYRALDCFKKTYGSIPDGPKHILLNTSFRAELATFPNGKFDDQVDSTSKALDWVRSGDRYCYGLLEYHKQIASGATADLEDSNIFIRPRMSRY